MAINACEEMNINDYREGSIKITGYFKSFGKMTRRYAINNP